MLISFLNFILRRNQTTKVSISRKSTSKFGHSAAIVAYENRYTNIDLYFVKLQLLYHKNDLHIGNMAYSKWR